MKMLRYLLAAAVFLLFLLLVVITGMAGDTLLSLWDRLQTAPWYITSLFALILLLFTITSVVILWKLLRPTKKRKSDKSPIDEQSLQQRINDAELSGIDITAAKLELKKLNQRRQTGKLTIALAGNISTGKSSLINSLLPGANAQTDVTGGTTTQVTEYHWKTPSSDEVILIDIPGLQDASDTGLSDNARQEASRAHLVIYLCDGDLTRQQLHELSLLAELKKPIILTLNKSDWYNKNERKQILQRLREHTRDINDISIVTTSTQASKQVLIKQPDGTESTEIRNIKPDIRELARALQQRIDNNPERLEKLRDSAIFTLAARSLDEAELHQKLEKGQSLVRNHTRSAIVGAMAAISPGTDILIQGALGISLIKSLCSLYDVPVSQLEIDRLLKLGQTRLNRHIALIMAVLGNALKAFPGLGTLAGGALHAVTYGMIFDALGRSLNEILASRGELATLPVINRFTENLGDQLEKRSSDIIRLVLESRDKKEK
ncbi:MAG: 50S ribosome-binding GTPase [Gammaproteobacteria bacterium]|nr:50S ribosome-binding GTPase [Gammaproteobacteria bacterium]